MTDLDELFDSSNKGRGMAQASRELIAAMHLAAMESQPITGRGVGYKLFARHLIASMSRTDMAPVYRLLKIARERGIIPWEWIVDETREIERKRSGWADPAAFVATVSRAYKRDFWKQQPKRVLVVSEKGTVRGLLNPVLRDLGVGFLVLHGFSSATAIHDLAEDYDGRDLILIYVGDYDPSGMYMSEEDIPTRLEKYEGDHIEVNRVALLREHCDAMPRASFPASDKGPKPGSKGDPRYKWFVRNYGKRCWELDAMDPNDLRDIVREAIEDEIEWDAWDRCAVVEKAEQESLAHVLDRWKTGGGEPPRARWRDRPRKGR
jgi:hypothetical protein